MVRLPRYWVYLVAFLLAGAPRFAVFSYDAPLWLVGAVVVVGRDMDRRPDREPVPVE